MAAGPRNVDFQTASCSAFLLGVRTISLSCAVQRIDPVKLLLAIGFQGIIVAGFNFIVTLRLLNTYKPSGLAAYFLTTPLFGVLQSWLVLGETITVRLLISAALVVGRIALASRPAQGAGQ